MLTHLYEARRSAAAVNGSREARDRVIRAAKIDERLEKEILRKSG